MSSIAVSDLIAARERIAAHVLRTPLVASPVLGQELGCELFFKCENLQYVGAFKARGACNAVFSLDDDCAARGVVAHSSGNHAAALARAATLRGVEAHIVMPRNSLPNKLAAVRSYGVDPTLCEPTAESREAEADEIVAETGATLIHPYDNRNVIAGQGTVGLELLEQIDDVDAVIVPVGGGGLLSGCLIAIKSQRPDVKVFAAEPAWADDAFRSLLSGRIEQPMRYDTIADGLRTPLGELTFPIIQSLVDDVWLADEETIQHATRCLLERAKLVAEPSGAVPLAAAMAHADRLRGKRVCCVISGGNLDFQSLNH